jgi:hypothetical protein
MSKHDYTPSAHLVGHESSHEASLPSAGLVWGSFVAVLVALIVLNVAFPDPAPASCARPQVAANDVRQSQ